MCILAIDPGMTTGWALTTSRGEVLGCGNFQPEDVGPGLDDLVRRTQAAGFTIEAVVEQMPGVGGLSAMTIALEFVRQSIFHWLVEIFDLPLAYVTPGTWKTSRVTKVTACPTEWDGKPMSQHQKDAVMIARYHGHKRGFTQFRPKEARPM